MDSSKKAILVAIVVSVAIVAALETGQSRRIDSKQHAKDREVGAAKIKYRNNTQELETKLRKGEISDSQMEKSLMHEQALLDYRTRVAENPGSAGCESELEIVSSTIRKYPIPVICEEGFTVGVWHEGPTQVIRAEWTTPNGDLIWGSPKLKPGYKSRAESLGDNRWLVEGNVTYHHQPKGDAVNLRITLE